MWVYVCVCVCVRARTCVPMDDCGVILQVLETVENGSINAGFIKATLQKNGFRGMVYLMLEKREI